MSRKSFIGVDIGTSLIKMAEVQKNDSGLEVVSLRKCPTPAAEDDALVSALKEVVPPGTRDVITCVSDGDVVSRIVQFPQLNKKELEAAVSYEMERLLPSSEKMLIRYVPLDMVQPGGSQELLLLAVQEDIVYRCYKMFSRAGLSLAAIDLSAFALWRLFARDTCDNRVIIDLGAKFTTILIVSNGIIRFIRTLSAGGDLLQCTSSCMFEDFDALNGIASEIHRSLVYYSNQENAPVEKAILTGGACRLEGLLDYLQDVIEVPAELGRPVIPELRQKEIDGTFAVAVGLALREVI